MGVLVAFAAGSAFGFIVPFEQVTETGEETLAGVMALVEFIMQGKKEQH